MYYIFYVGHSTTTLSQWVSFHLNYISNSSKHLQKYPCLHLHFRKILAEKSLIHYHEKNKYKLKFLEGTYIKI